MMTQEMKATQDAYWARPWTARVETSHFSGTFKFYTGEAAIKYIFDQFAVVERIIRNREYGSSWVSFDCNRSYVEGPDGKVPARDLLLVSALSTSAGLVQ